MITYYLQSLYLMVSERKDVKYPLWRKKMDTSMFEHKSTFIPHWVIDNVFCMREYYPYSSKKDPRSEIEIEYRHPSGRISRNIGWVITTRYESGRNDITRLFISKEVRNYLIDDFIMTFHRSNERKFRNCSSSVIEMQIPFWEFLDIEYNSEDGVFIFTPHYIHPVKEVERFSYL